MRSTIALPGLFVVVMMMSAPPAAAQALPEPEAPVRETVPAGPLPRLEDQISEFVRRIHQDSRGDFWFGTNSDGVILYRGTDAAPGELPLEYFSPRRGFGGHAVRGIVEDRAGHLWFGTSDGLTRYDGTSFTTFTEADGLIGNDIWSLTIDSAGVMWIGTHKGVSRFDGTTFTPFKLPESPLDPTRGVSSRWIVNSIIEDSRGRMWFATSGGVYIHDGESLEHLSEADGLCNNAVNCILEDR